MISVFVTEKNVNYQLQEKCTLKRVQKFVAECEKFFFKMDANKVKFQFFTFKIPINSMAW